MTDFKIKKGVDIPLIGKPKKNITNISESTNIKIHPNKIKGIKPNRDDFDNNTNIEPTIAPSVPKTGNTIRPQTN